MAKKEPSLYFVALVPDDPVLSAVHKLKLEMAEKYQSKAALKSPPHITLHMPFRYQEDKEEKIFDALKEAVTGLSEVEVFQKGFGCFEPRVIFVNVDKSDALAELQKCVVRSLRKNLNLDNADYKNRGFHPHMTIGFRDLKKLQFKQAWEYYQDQDIKLNWKADSIALLKHNGKSWDCYRNFPLNK